MNKEIKRIESSPKVIKNLFNEKEINEFFKIIQGTSYNST